ncbi:LysE family translocator [Labrys sp. KNU-23]|uniref:LysE family translocator n=1 Tax=Labrys sp. KNU-23 TaxID=2789216 RepID=UPI0011EE43F2|nr:LysE family translocator [Labrys sp. KNU-23]QEN89911.1 LysE family translocator [Labrys sp. KNU-23]
MSVEAFVKLFLLVFPLMFSPGPTNFLCAASGSRHGVVRSVPMILGMDLMVFLPALVVGLGVTGFLVNYPGLLTMVQLVGALVVLYIAFEMARGASPDAPTASGAQPMGFWGGMLVQGLNVKGLTLLLIIYAQFQLADKGLVANALIIAIALTVLSLVSHFVWTLGAMWLARRFSSPQAMRIQGFVYAFMLALVAVWMMASALTGAGS